MFPVLTRDDVYRIETPRLWLRWPRLEDAHVLATWVGKREVATMTSRFKVDMTAGEIAERLESMRASNAAGTGIGLAMTLKGDDARAIGLIGVSPDGDGKLGLGYQLNPDFWSRGLMTEAVRALAMHSFELSSACRIVASVRPDNHGSIKVLKKSGFVTTGGGEHESPLYGRYMVRHFELKRQKPSALAAASARFRLEAVPA